MMTIPHILLGRFQSIEPRAQFTGSLPKLRSLSTGKLYYAKLGGSREVEQYVGEAESLKAIGEATSPNIAPCVLDFGVEDGRPYFISEYKELGRLTESSANVLAKRLATELHAHKSPNGFGFSVPTFCGATKLKNGWYDSWDKCFGAMISDLLDRLGESGRYTELCKKGELVVKKVIPKLLGPLDIRPVLLHGDLWSGNTGTDVSTGQPVIFDPSSYYGHNEADLAIARIFGGFPRSFFTTYHQHFPKTEPVDQYELRGDLYELFHYLNHTALFGGGYASNALGKMDALL